MLTFIAAVFFLLITPGPGVLSVAGVGSGFGRGAGTRYLWGLFVGANLVALAVVSGLAAVVLADGRIRTVLFGMSVLYLLFLAYRIAFAGSKIAFIQKQHAPGFLGGIALQIINPKAYAVNTALFTGFLFWPAHLMAETLVKFVVINAIWIPIHFLWLYFGIRLGALNLPGATHRKINIAMALSMVLVVGLAVWAQF